MVLLDDGLARDRAWPRLYGLQYSPIRVELLPASNRQGLRRVECDGRVDHGGALSGRRHRHDLLGITLGSQRRTHMACGDRVPFYHPWPWPCRHGGRSDDQDAVPVYCRIWFLRRAADLLDLADG